MVISLPIGLWSFLYQKAYGDVIPKEGRWYILSLTCPRLKNSYSNTGCSHQSGSEIVVFLCFVCFSLFCLFIFLFVCLLVLFFFLFSGCFKSSCFFCQGIALCRSRLGRSRTRSLISVCLLAADRSATDLQTEWCTSNGEKIRSDGTNCWKLHELRVGTWGSGLTTVTPCDRQSHGHLSGEQLFPTLLHSFKRKPIHMSLRSGRSGVRIPLVTGFFWAKSYQWLKNWHSSGYPVRRLAI